MLLTRRSHNKRGTAGWAFWQVGKDALDVAQVSLNNNARDPNTPKCWSQATRQQSISSCQVLNLLTTRLATTQWSLYHEEGCIQLSRITQCSSSRHKVSR